MSSRPESHRLSRILLAYTVNEFGTWAGYIALALGVYDKTHSAIATAGLFVARGLLPALLAPILVARLESPERRTRLGGLYLLEAALAVALAGLLWRFWLPGVLILVAVDGAVAVAATALLRAAAARIACEEAIATHPGAHEQSAEVEAAQRRMGAQMNFAFMSALAVGPVIGGVLVHALGSPVAMLLDAFALLVSGLLLFGQRAHVEEAIGTIRARLAAAWQHLQAVPQLRTLLITEAIAVVVFSSVEPVEVIYAERTLHAGDLGFGLLVAAWGLGAAIGAVIFARSAQRPLGPMLTLGTLLVGLAYLGFAAAPTLAVACSAAIVGGIGNGVQWPSLISAVQRLTPAGLQGRLMSAVGSMNALCPAIGFALGGMMAALGPTRVAMAIAGVVASLATIAFLRISAHLALLPSAAEVERGPAEELLEAREEADRAGTRA